MDNAVGLVAAVAFIVAITCFGHSIRTWRHRDDPKPEKFRVKSRPIRPQQPIVMPHDLVDIEERRDGTFRRVRGRRPLNLPIDGRK